MNKEDRNNRSVAYLPATTVISELHRMVDELSAVGVSPDCTTMGGSFAAWSDGLQSGQVAWLYSLDRFRSITELMAYCESMKQRGVVLYSLRDPWFNNPEISGNEVLSHLFLLGEAIHSKAMLGVLAPRAIQVEPIGGISALLIDKAQRAIELRASRNLSVVTACRLAGCGVTAYYAYLKAQKKGSYGKSRAL